MTGSGEAHRLLVQHPAVDADGAPVEGVALVTLDRPEVLNALDGETLRQRGRRSRSTLRSRPRGECRHDDLRSGWLVVE